ncbi:hypothetical protein MKW92_046815, partial [Papaver armeniacum]
VKAPLHQSYSFYTGYDYSDIQDPQASGAYIFRPNGTFPLRSGSKVPVTVLRGPVLDEVHQQVNEWIHQITRVYKGKEHAEVEFIVGPIPVEDEIGKEITTKISTTLKTNKTFYTDSNGRDFIKRVRDYRADWDLQINLGIYVEDDKTELSVLVDRSVGGSSLMDGQVELMLHRGVVEALNETVCVADKCTGLIIQGNFYLRIDPVGEGQVASFIRSRNIFSLPDNVAILTLQELVDGKMGEDRDLSKMARVELKKLFPYKKIGKVTEMSLSANQAREEMERKRLVWKNEGSSDKS